MKAEIDVRIMDEMPYTIGSVDELEIVGQLIKSVGIDGIFSAKTKAANRDILLRSFGITSYPSELSHARNFLFEAKLERLIPNTAESWLRNLRSEI